MSLQNLQGTKTLQYQFLFRYPVNSCKYSLQAYRINSSMKRSSIIPIARSKNQYKMDIFRFYQFTKKLSMKSV